MGADAMTIFSGGFADDPPGGGPARARRTVRDHGDDRRRPTSAHLRECPRTLADIFTRSAAHGDLDSMVYRDQRLTFTDIHRRSRSPRPSAPITVWRRVIR